MQRLSKWISRTLPLLLAGVALAAPDGDGKADLQFTKQANLSPQEIVAQARAYRTKMDDAQRYVASLHADALKKKDVIKLNCVGDKLTQIKGHCDLADKSLTQLTDPNIRLDEGGRQHEFTRMTILDQKVSGLRDEAQGCIGEDITFFGDQRVTIDIDPSIMAADPTSTDITPQVDTVPRPTEASPAT